MNVIVEFKGKIVDIDGVKYVKVPEFEPHHVTQGDKADYTPRSLTAAQELLRLRGSSLARVDHPRLTHVSGDFIGTFTANLGTFKQQKAARHARETFFATDWDRDTETLWQYEGRAYNAVLEAFEVSE